MQLPRWVYWNILPGERLEYSTIVERWDGKKGEGEGMREEGIKGGRDRGREGSREGGREGGIEGGREGGRM